jgi:hypothetical protein
VRDPVELDRVSQRAHDVLLADDLVEVLRPVRSIKRRHDLQITGA